MSVPPFREQPDLIPHASFRRAAVWMVSAVAVFGALLSWASIQGGNISRWMPATAIPKSKAPIAIPAAETQGLLARGARIQTTQCAGCHQPDERSAGPSYQEILEHYNGQGDSVLADLAEGVNHPSPGWGGYATGPASDLPQNDRVAVAYWLMHANLKGTN